MSAQQAPDVVWRRAFWGGAASCAAVTAGAVASGDGWVERVGAPTSGWWWWALPLSLFTHLSVAHLAGNALAWWVTCRAAAHSALAWRPVVAVVTAGWAVGVAAHLASGSPGHLHGASAGIVAAAAWVAVLSTGRWRVGCVLICVLAVAATSADTSGVAHLAGAALGAAAGSGRRWAGWATKVPGDDRPT